jgi:alkyldihydroxyacetonephosphate synthase
MSVDRTKIKWNGWGWAAHKDTLAAREDVWAWLAEELGMPSLLATPARPLDNIVLPETHLAPGVRARLVEMLGPERVRDDAYERAFHALGQSYHDLIRLRAGDLSAAPDAVLYPRGTDEVLALLAFAAERDIAVVPSRSTASSRSIFPAWTACSISTRHRARRRRKPASTAPRSRKAWPRRG